MVFHFSFKVIEQKVKTAWVEATLSVVPAPATRKTSQLNSQKTRFAKQKATNQPALHESITNGVATDSVIPNIITPVEELEITKMPELKNEVRIPYPRSAKEKNIGGKVIATLLIDETGKVHEISILESPDEDLKEAALVAMRSFQFQPARIGEKAVAVKIRYIYSFVLEN